MEANAVAQGKNLVEAMVRDQAARLGVSVEGLEWGQDADDFRLGRHSLVCIVTGQRTVQRFSVEDLSDMSSTPNIRRRLAEQVSLWLTGVAPSKQIGFRPPSLS